VSIATCHHLLVTGNADEAHRRGLRALAISESLGDLALSVTVNLYCGATCLCGGDFAHAEGHLATTVRLLEGDQQRERFGLHGLPAAIARSYLAWALAERGDFGEAVRHGRDGCGHRRRGTPCLQPGVRLVGTRHAARAAG